MESTIQGLAGITYETTTLERVVQLAQAHLSLDRVCVVELTAAGPQNRACAADGQLDTSPRQVLADVDDLAWVPLNLPDGTPYGKLCYSGVAPGTEQAARGFMSMLGELVRPELDQCRAHDQLHQAIQGLIETDDIALAFQPIFELGTMRCIGVEALARFQPPFPSPDRMFLRAEQVGLGLQLEELVVVHAWPVLEQLTAGRFLSLNLTPAAVLTLARRANQRPEIDLSGIVVEVTEHRAIDAYGEMRRELEQLRDRGLRLAVDDAGAGYASLRHVLELQPDLLKIDRSLIHGLSDDCDRRAVVRSVLSLARDLGSLVVAEGVERPSDLAAVQELGIDAAQGFLLGRPSTDPGALAEWVSTDRQAERV